MELITEGDGTLPEWLLNLDVLLPGPEGDVAPPVFVQMRNANVPGNGMWDGKQGYERLIGWLNRTDEAKLRQFLPKETLARAEGEEGEAVTFYHPLRALDENQMGVCSFVIDLQLCAALRWTLHGCLSHR